ncbi:phosphotransferase [Actinomadura coerulea]|uniref:phosphotransferase n=1 Tax=Actinomadura coerulea TaxID=46159 RepID=UPI003428C7CD
MGVAEIEDEAPTSRRPPPWARPRLIAAAPALRAILTTAPPGTVVRILHLAPAAETHVHRLAGGLLRCWHDHPAPAPPQARAAVATALAGQAREAAECLTGLSGHLAADERDLVHAAAQQLPELKDLPLICTHGNFSPRNWVRAPHRRTLGLIDFESATHALAVQDLVWLPGALWPTRPDLWEAFLAGYGRALTADEHQALLLLTTRLAASYLAAGVSQGALSPHRPRP